MSIGSPLTGSDSFQSDRMQKISYVILWTPVVTPHENLDTIGPNKSGFPKYERRTVERALDTIE